MSISKAMRQMPASAGRAGAGCGEAVDGPVSDEAGGTRHDTGGTGSALINAMLTKENMEQAWKRVEANKGAGGVDGLDICQTKLQLMNSWPEIREQLRQGTYRPSPVRRVTIPKPNGGERELGIPTVTDRLIQQALLQVLQPILDPTFSRHSFGFRPGRSAHGAVRLAKRYVQSGRRIVVDVDLEKFFDRINHDILIDRLQKRIGDVGVVRVIRAYLNSGIMWNGVVYDREQGSPQGGPLSPLLANVMLDEVDKELERRGHCFVRYADDLNVYVCSAKAGERVMKLLRKLYTGLHLTVNEAKSAVTSVIGRKFLGYSFWRSQEDEIKYRVADKPLADFKHRIRQLTRRVHGRSMADIVKRLRSYMLGWKAYFKLAQTPSVWRVLDGWIRHRLRAIHLKHWGTGRTAYRELRRLGVVRSLAACVAVNCRRWWHGSAHLLNAALTIAYFDELGVPRLS